MSFPTQVRQRATGAKRACKKIEMPRDAASANLVQTEIAVLKTLDHPNIVRLHEIFLAGEASQGGSIYLIMELCTGGPLLEALAKLRERQRVGEEQVSEWVRRAYSQYLTIFSTPSS